VTEHADGQVTEAGDWSEGRYFTVPAAPSEEEMARAVEVLRRWEAANGSVSPIISSGAGAGAGANRLKSAPTASAAIRGDNPETDVEAYGVVGTSASVYGAGVAAANTEGGPDLVLDGSLDGATDTELSEWGLMRSSPADEVFTFNNGGGGDMNVHVAGTLTGSAVDVDAIKVGGMTVIDDVGNWLGMGETVPCNACVGADELAADAVTSAAIADGAIVSADLADESVTSDKIEFGGVTSSRIDGGAVTGDKLADGAVTAAKLASGAVTEGKIATGAVTAAVIRNNAVTSAAILDGAVAASDLADESVTSSKIELGAVQAGHLDPGAITGAAILDGSVDTVDLATGAVTSDRLATGAVTTTKIQDAAVAMSKIASNAVVETKIANGAVSTAKIMNGAISTAKIVDQAVTGAKVDASEVQVRVAASCPSGSSIRGIGADGSVACQQAGDDLTPPVVVSGSVASGVAFAVANTGGYGTGIRGEASGESGTGVRGLGFATGGRFESTFLSNGVGIVARGGTTGHAALFEGNVMIADRDTGDAVIELGKGLDYAEGFDVSDRERLEPGTVLVIDPSSPGELTMSRRPYDTGVAGIIAGANRLGSGVRLGAGGFDHDVALAGRVYCKVDASNEGIRPGDLLTTASTPGHAMKATDADRSRGAILGKAMEPLTEGATGQILVLVTLQ